MKTLCDGDERSTFALNAPEQRAARMAGALLAGLLLAAGIHAFAQTTGQTPGTVVSWGQQVIPYVAPGTRFKAVAATANHNLALKQDGTVIAWGDNTYGQTTVPSGLSGVIALATGELHSLALKQDGTVVAWGDNFPGQTTVPSGLSGVIAVAAGAYHNLALKQDGSVVAWGDNQSGQATVPSGLSGVIAVAAGSSSHSLAVKQDRSVVAWGNNSEGQTTVPNGLSGVVAVAAGYGHSLALKQDGTVVAWGRKDYGQAIVPSGLTGVVAVAAGGCHNLALKQDGTVVAWGDNDYGQAIVPSGLSGVVALAAGSAHSLALKQDGTVVAWGINQSGQATVPSGLSGVVALAAGSAHSLALKQDGTVVAWGDNFSGWWYVPSALGSVMAVAAGADHSLALVAAPAQAVVGNLRAAQRPGTALVDLFYDLSGAGSGYSGSVTVSSDGGASFTVPATHFTGDGVTSPVAPGAGRLIVWNVGADFPGQFSTKMRLKVVAGAGSALSPIFTLDTRAVSTGTLTGVVQAGGAPVANALARVDGTGFVANTGADGRFTLANVPAGSGYLLKVSAAGFASKQVPGITVTSGTRDLGTIQLTALSGPYRLVPLQPDVNLPVSQAQEGGVAYRYYRVVAADGKTPAGGVTLQARLAGGAGIAQTGDVAENWPGREAGVSDADGIVRIGVPSSAIGGAGTTRKVEVLDAGRVLESFDVRIWPFKHEKVWGHSLDGSVGGKLGAVRLEPGGKLETEVRDSYTGTSAYQETIERTRSLTGKAGVEASVGSLKLGSVKAGAKAGLGGYMDLQWSGKWQFNPDEYSGVLNMQKVYFAFGDVIFLGPLGAEFYGKLSDYWYGAGLQDILMVESGGEVHLGGYFNGEAGFGVGNLGPVNVRAGAELEGSLGGFLGYERSYSLGQIQEHTILFGFEGEVQGGIGATAAFSKFNGNRLRGLGGGLHVGEHNTLSGRVQTDWNTGRVKAASVELENEVSSGGGISFLGWKGVEAPLGGDEKVKLSETYTLTFSGTDSFGKVAALGKLWAAVRPGSGIKPVMNNAGVDETSAALAGAAEESGSWATYERSVHRTYQGEFTFPIGANTLAAALELDFTAQAERGAVMVVERGVAPGGRLFPQEYQPDQSRGLIPSDQVYDKELLWLSRAEFPPTSGFSRFSEYVSTANPSLTIGGRFSMFFHDVAGGAQIVGSDFIRLVGGGSPAPRQGPRPQKGPLPGPLPQDYHPAPGQTNYVYGVSGLLQLTPGTNAFPGTATLVMPYSDEQIAGLNGADLRIYRLPDGTNQWQLVGGIVDLASNSVTTVISNFGTYAIAAPMPSGVVNLQATNLNLVADGTNELTLMAANLLLNTGGMASNAWLFTVDAAGVELLDADVSTNWAGVQAASSNGVLQVRLRAPVGGTYASVSVSSVAGDARGRVGINLIDAVPPVAPANVLASAGQSRIWLSWQTNSEPDIAGYRVYYRAGTAGPPWDGTAAVEGAESPVSVTGTNCLLRGLAMGTNYFASVAAVDTTGNESALAPALSVTTSEQPPNPPTGVAARFGEDGTNVLMWTLSEDDGYNDRDVVRYDVWRLVMPGTNWLKAGEVGAGIGLYSGTNLAVGPTQFIRYAVVAVDSSGLSSTRAPGNRLMASGTGFDNDGDGLPDDWERQYGLSPENPGDALADSDGDGLTNLQEYHLGRNPTLADPLRFGSVMTLENGVFNLSVEEVLGRSVTLKASTNLMNWFTVTNSTGSDGTIYFRDATATDEQRFYRAVTP